MASTRWKPAIADHQGLLSRLEEKPVQVDMGLCADFPTEPRDAKSGDIFNDLGHEFPRENKHLAMDNADVLQKMNDYDFYGSAPATAGYYCLAFGTCGLYYCMKRRVVPAGFWGHYVDSGRHFLTKDGTHTLTSVKAYWKDIVPIDDLPGENPNLVRRFGRRMIVTVPENYVAGGYRIGKEKDDDKDGEYVLFGQGRHVFQGDYRNVQVVKLDSDWVELGPVTIVYIKEGYIGGAYERNTGQYRILHPGPPYILHEKDWEQVTMVQRTLETFKVGPITFLTVREGQLGGAYVKDLGLYQLLPPGHTYMLHQKTYEGAEVCNRDSYFTLGPWMFITVYGNVLAGAYTKKGGEFVLLPRGKTYQLNKDEFGAPHMVQRDKHVVKCGPLTFISLQEGVLEGAYRTKDGLFEEFSCGDAEGGEFVVHDRDYYGLTTVNKYSHEVQSFGPNKIVTIPEGWCGVFEREGIIEIKEPGYYKVSAAYKIRKNLPLQINSERLRSLRFRTKDGVVMHMSAVAVWRVQSPVLVAKRPGGWEDLVQTFRKKAEMSLTLLLKRFSREELLPTKQDALLRSEEATEEEVEIDEDAAYEEAVKAVALSEENLRSVEADCLELLNTASNDGGWGLDTSSVRIDSIELADREMMGDLESIAQALLSTRRMEAEAEKEAAGAIVDGETAMTNVVADSEVKKKIASAKATATTTKARAVSAIKMARATTRNQIARMQASNSARSKLEAVKIEHETEQEVIEIKKTIKYRTTEVRRLEGETEAFCVRTMAEARFDQGCKEQEVATLMPSQQFELRRLALVVEALKHYGNANWRYPKEMLDMMTKLRPYLRLGGMSHEEVAEAESMLPGFRMLRGGMDDFV